MGITCKPIGKMASVMRKLQNEQDNEAKMAKRMTKAPVSRKRKRNEED